MMYWYLGVGVLLMMAVIVIYLILKIRIMKKAVREIRRTMERILSEDTNNVIGISSGDKDIRELAAYLNKQLKVLRSERIRCRQGDKELKDAVTNISHDLRTPLTAMFGYLDMLEREEKSEKAQQYLKAVTGRADAICQLTEELLKYSAAVSEMQDLELEKVTVNHVLEESISAFYAVLKGRNIFPEIEICEKKVRRSLNKTALSRIFSNILSNAVRYSGGDLNIILSEDGEIQFSNTAPQLDKVTVCRLFDRFYTVENAGRTTGLGLSIAKALTEAMNGTIGAEYRDNRLIIRLQF